MPRKGLLRYQKSVGDGPRPFLVVQNHPQNSPDSADPNAESIITRPEGQIFYKLVANGGFLLLPSHHIPAVPGLSRFPGYLRLNAGLQDVR